MFPLYYTLYFYYPTHCLAHRNLLDFAKGKGHPARGRGGPRGSG